MEGRKEGREGRDGKEGRKEGRKGSTQEGRKEGRIYRLFCANQRRKRTRCLTGVGRKVRKEKKGKEGKGRKRKVRNVRKWTVKEGKDVKGGRKEGKGR
jgi:hypothetical protein